MGTFFASRRNQVLVALAAVIFVVLAALFLGLSRRPKVDVSSAGSGTVSPSPSGSPTPDVSPSPSDTSSPGPSPSASLAPSAVPSEGPPSSPVVTGPALTTAGHELNPPSAAVADRMGSGAPCYETWMDSGWTIDHSGSTADCGILFIRGSDQGGSVAYVIEHRGSAPNIQRRVYLMTGTDAWHVRLAASDDAGTRYDAIGVMQGNIAGAPFPQVIVGFRINGTGQFLTYDIVDMAADGSLAVSGSRNLDHGSANISGNQLVDYTPYPNATTPDYFIRTVIGYSAGAYRLVDDSHAPERPAGNLVPPP